MRSFFFVLGIVVAAGSARAVSTEEAKPAFTERLVELDFNTLSAELGKAKRDLTREERLVLSLSMLNQSLKSAANTEKAAGLLRDLVAEDGRDDIGLWSRYQLARVAQLHLTPQRPREAAEAFRSLVADAPAHSAAQRARLKLAVLLIYERQVEPSREKGYAEAEGLVRALPKEEGLAEGHLLLGRAAVFFKLSGRTVREHLEAALSAGIVHPPSRASSLITVAELARAESDWAAARDHYRLFLEENRRDQRVNLVRERLSEVEGRL